MLQALDYLAQRNIVHRDVKPRNILYNESSTGEPFFQLTDFGIGTFLDRIQSTAGTRRYIAPESCLQPIGQQTSKIDVWSLFVTLLFALNINDIRSKSWTDYPTWIDIVLETAQDPRMDALRDMAHKDPVNRASAADILDDSFNGEGRTHPSEV
jgi:serine/threonine protein kinase